jgi:hypothetical protein
MSRSRRKAQSKVVLRVEELERRDAPAVLTPTTFANAGISFNTAVRGAEGGFYNLAVQESNQAISTVNTFNTNLQNVMDTIAAERLVGGDLHNVSAATNTHLNTIVGDLTTAMNNALNSINGGAAGTAVHNALTQILNIVNGDATLKAKADNANDLAAAAPGYASLGFQQVPKRLPAGVTAENAPQENLAQIGRIFDDSSNRLIGGVGSAANKAAILADLRTVRADLQDMIENEPDQFGDGLTLIHARTMVVQIPGEIRFINDVGVNPVANHGTRDISLDLIDIVQGDPNLANMDNQGGVMGFNVFPDPRTAPTRYQDNQEQTNAFAFEIAQGNTLGVQAINLVTNHPEDTGAIDALIVQFRNLSEFANNFDSAQPLIFRARFDNEQLRDTGTQRAAINAMIHGLQTEDVALVTVAREAISQNWADNAGNNIPVTGGTYNVDGFTIAEVLSTAH